MTLRVVVCVLISSAASVAFGTAACGRAGTCDRDQRAVGPGVWKHAVVVYTTTEGELPLAVVALRLTAFQGSVAAPEPAEARPLRALDKASTVINLQHPAMATIEVRLDVVGSYTSTLIVTAPGLAPIVRRVHAVAELFTERKDYRLADVVAEFVGADAMIGSRCSTPHNGWFPTPLATTRRWVLG